MRQRKTKLPPFLEEATQQRGEHGGPHADFFPLFLLLLINKSCMREESRHVCFDYLLESACFFFPPVSKPDQHTARESEHAGDALRDIFGVSGRTGHDHPVTQRAPVAALPARSLRTDRTEFSRRPRATCFRHVGSVCGASKFTCASVLVGLVFSFFSR